MLKNQAERGTNYLLKNLQGLGRIRNRTQLVFERVLGFLEKNKMLFSLGKESEEFWRCLMINQTR